MALKLSIFLLRSVFQALFCFITMSFFVLLSGVPFSYNEFPDSLIFYAFCALFFLLYFMPNKSAPALTSRKTILFWGVIIIIAIPFIGLKMTLGTNGVEPIIIFLRDNGIAEIMTVGRVSFREQTKLMLWGVMLLIASGVFLAYYVKNFTHVLMFFSVLYLLFSPLSVYIFRQFVPNSMHNSFDHAAEIQPPVILEKPEQQKNVVFIYIESLERTYNELPVAKDDFQPFIAMEQNAIHATNIDQIIGSRYTIAGMVASQCGVPLLPKGLNQALFAFKGSDISLDVFLPKIRCLGDILREAGYVQSYMNGANVDKFSKRGFLTTHGYTRLFDENSLPSEGLKEYKNVWGLNDEVLFDKAREEIDYLAALNKPFVLSLLTIATHGPDGFLDTTCEPKTFATTQTKLPDAIRCTANHVDALYQHLEARGLSDDTVFVILSDHLASHGDISDALKTFDDARRNTFIVKDGSPTHKITKHATQLDIYPTLLEILGYEIKDRRANLGISLLSNEPNLLDKIGSKDLVNDTFYNNYKMGNYLWREE